MMAAVLMFANVRAVHAEETPAEGSNETVSEVTEPAEDVVSETDEEISAEEGTDQISEDSVTETEEVVSEADTDEKSEETEETETDISEEEPENEVKETAEETGEAAAEETENIPEEEVTTEESEAEEEAAEETEQTGEIEEPVENSQNSDTADGDFALGEPAVYGMDESVTMADTTYPNIFTGTKSYTYKQTEGRRILDLVNNFRTSGNAWVWNSDGTKTTNIKVDALEYDYALEQIAMQRAAEISVLFAHQRPSGQSWYTAVYVYDGVTYRTNGENILYGSGPYGANAESSFDMWKEENEGYSGQGHRRNMLGSSYTGMGIGYASVNGYNFWVMELGYKTPVPESDALNGKKTIELPVHTAYISSYGSWTAEPSEYWLAADETAVLPEITASVTVKGMMGSFSMNAWPYAGSAESSDTSVFEITEDTSQIHALSIGDALLNVVIPAGSSEKKFAVPVHVVIKVTGVRLDQTETSVDRGDSIQLHAEVLPENATVRDVTWSSSDSSVASVDADGVVTGKKAGTAVITAVTKDGGFAASCTVNVEVHVMSVAFNDETFTVREGQTDVLDYVIEPEDASDQSVSWSSSDESVLTVDSDGILTALKPGTSVITITTNDRGRTDTIEVTVAEKLRAEIPYLSFYDESGSLNTVHAGETAELRKGTEVSLHTETDSAELYYTVSGEETEYTKPFAVNETCSITAYARKSGLNDSDSAVFSVVVKDESVSADAGDLTEEDIEEVNAKYGGIVPDGIWAAGIPESVTYTGSKITFDDLRVYDHKTLLDKSSCTVSYKNNINASEETFDTQIGWTPPKKTTISYVQITGKGNYTGKIYVPFAIEKKNLEDEDAAVSDLWLKASGKTLKPVPEVVYNGKKLKNKTDFTITYIDENDTLHSFEEGISEAGNYLVRISGAEKNYTGNRTVSLQVDEDKNTVLMSKAKIKIGGWSASDGMPVTENTTLDITVSSGKYILDPSVYKVKTIINGTHAGTASAVIEGTGEADPVSGIILLGEKKVNFKITGISIKKAAAEIPVQLYTGTNVDPDSFTVKLNDTVLEKDTDYEIVSYSSDIKAGKAKVTIRGIGEYTDTRVFQYQIAKADIALAGAEIPSSASYQPSGAVPAVRLTYEGILLKAGTDYTVKYSGNKAAGMTASYLIKGKGNFTGQLSGTYTVTRKDLGETVLTVNDVAWNASKKGSYYRTKFTLKDGTKSVSAKEYDRNAVTYTYKFDTRVPKSAGSSNTVVRLAGSRVQDNDIPPVGTVICVSVSAAENGNYEGSVSASYRVIPAAYNISKAKVQFMTDSSETPVKSLVKDYTGSAVTLSEDELYITMKINGAEYVLSPEDFEIVSYTSNIRKGTAKAVIKGTGDFGGTKTIQFKIGTQRLSLAGLLFS